MPRTRCRLPKVVPLAPNTLAVATQTLSVPAKRQTRTIQSKYRSRRQKKPTSKDTAGEIYLLEGYFKGTRFLKVGRSVNSQRRLEQHRRTCKRVRWTSIYKRATFHCHKAEACVHLKMGCVGFTRVRVPCCCGRTHEEWFELQEGLFSQSKDIVERIIWDHRNTTTEKTKYVGYTLAAGRYRDLKAVVNGK
ncbi:hypothetical protein PQX77_015159 [Marasmius sp. AFHP31]|nr:hypothetical protein PQX77_019022 [Marasmius sp. AFHP31]KAK1222017.1 hypothetical protein PQX77_015159 [Marasmius sp. AFHP31]